MPDLMVSVMALVIIRIVLVNLRFRGWELVSRLLLAATPGRVSSKVEALL